MAHNAFAVDKYPATEAHRELDPFAPAVLMYARICSERQPENEKYYQAAVKAVFDKHQDEYIQLISDSEFEKEFREFEKESNSMRKVDLDSLCEDILMEGKEAIRKGEHQK